MDASPAPTDRQGASAAPRPARRGTRGPGPGEPGAAGSAGGDAAGGSDAADDSHAAGKAGATGAAEAGAPQVVLVGTGHVFRIQDAVRGAIQALEPDVVFVELDHGRFQALMHRERTGQRPEGRGGFVHGRLQRFQESVAGLYGAEVGSEMVAAVRGAQDVGARLVLVDAPGEQTIRRALRQLTFRERLRAVGQVVQAGVRRVLPARDARQSMDEEIRKYQSDPAAALDELRRQYPTIHRVLIDERDESMAQHIRRAMEGARLGVAVVGDGHVDGIRRRLGPLVGDVYRLPDVREGRLPQMPLAHGDATDVTYGFDVRV